MDIMYTYDTKRCNFQCKITCQFARKSLAAGAPPRTPLGCSPRPPNLIFSGAVRHQLARFRGHFAPNILYDGWSRNLHPWIFSSYATGITLTPSHNCLPPTFQTLAT